MEVTHESKTVVRVTQDELLHALGLDAEGEGGVRNVSMKFGHCAKLLLITFEREPAVQDAY
jgi:hypothetical protein